MANICYNEFIIRCEPVNTSEIENKIDELFNERLNGEISYVDESGCIEGYFDSRWTFPMHIFENIFDNFENVYFRCISTEFGCDYVACNIFDDGAWREEQTFDL